MADSIAYKVLTASQWAVLHAGPFLGSPVDLTDGFIHLSTAGQLTATVDRHFAGQAGLIVAAIDLTSLADHVRWEPSRGGQLFPHVYAPIRLDHVISTCSMARDANGVVQLPDLGRDS